MPARMIQTNEEALEEAAKIQQKSKDAVSRMQQRVAETDDMALNTLEDLYERRRQMEAIEQETNRIHETLDETEQLQAKLGSLFGWLKPQTNKAIRQIDGAVANTTEEVTPKSARKKTKKMWKKAFGAGTTKKNKFNNNDDGTNKPDNTEGTADSTEHNGDYKDQIKTLEDGDKELDDQLDILGMQLENLTALAEEMGDETNLQHKKMNRVRDNMIDVHVRQYQAVDKTRKFIGTERTKAKAPKEESIVPKPSLF